jgi:predicted nicotinamide N-methyase
MSCLNEHHTLTQGLSRSKDTRRFRILELGAGCGIVGIAIAQVLTETDVTLTDLPEAQEIIERNISRAHFAKESTLAFQVLDWDAELPRNLSTSSSRLDLVVAADCTYNSDSRYNFHISLLHVHTKADKFDQPSASQNTRTTRSGLT